MNCSTSSKIGTVVLTLAILVWMKWYFIVVLICITLNAFFHKIIGYPFPGGSDGKESACSAGDLVQSPGREDPLEKEMATHSIVLTWRIPWTEEP